MTYFLNSSNTSLHDKYNKYRNKLNKTILKTKQDYYKDQFIKVLNNRGLISIKKFNK